jgi:thiaminase/transcriptional activator TenA
MGFSMELIERNRALWDACYEHAFVQELGQGVLTRERFKFYLLQDYLYLYEFAKVFALAAVKSPTYELLTRFSTLQYETLSGEMQLHRDYMKSFGISEADVEATRPALFNKTYTSYMLSCAQTGDLPQIIAALLPCAATYGDFARRLKAHYASEFAHNPYKSWIEAYASAEYADLVKWLCDTLDELAPRADEERLNTIFRDSLEFEYLFWDMSYKMKMSEAVF